MSRVGVSEGHVIAKDQKVLEDQEGVECCCPEVEGACCLPDGTCRLLTPTDCIEAGGTVPGQSTCDPYPCLCPTFEFAQANCPGTFSVTIASFDTECQHVTAKVGCDLNPTFPVVIPMALVPFGGGAVWNSDPNFVIIACELCDPTAFQGAAAMCSGAGLVCQPDLRWRLGFSFVVKFSTVISDCQKLCSFGPVTECRHGVVYESSSFGVCPPSEDYTFLSQAPGGGSWPATVRVA